MKFKKYNSITNHYNLKDFHAFIKYNYENFPDVIRFQVTEKIHGANFSILAEDGKIKLAKRTDFLGEDEKFYGYQEVMANTKYIPVYDALLEISRRWGKAQLYGEFFGGKVQKGVWYGAEKRFLWYALKVNDEFIPNADADEVLADIMDFKVPVIDMIEWDIAKEDIAEFIDRIPYKFTSKLTPEGYEEDNICEGTVTVPYDIVPMFGDNYFAIKKKNQEFEDKKSDKKVVKVAKEIPENVQEIIAEFVSYINNVRTNDLMSKMGEMEKVSQLSVYAKAYFRDVMDDFLIDNKDEWIMLDKLFQKEVTKAGSAAIFTELKRYLTEG